MSVSPAFAWPGGKRRLVKHILPLIPSHTCYVEPFAGGLAVLLAKDRSPVEVVNDLDGDLVNFYRCVRFHCDELLKELQWVVNSRVEFVATSSQPGLTDIQRAARWFTRISLSFGAKGDTYGYGRTSGGTAASGSRTSRMARIAALSERLDRVNVEHLDWRDCLRRYDAASTCVYLDPPYTAGLQYDAQAWSEDDHRELRETLGRLRGTWVLSYDDSPLVRGLYEGFEIRSIERATGIGNTSGKTGRRYREVLIRPPVRL